MTQFMIISFLCLSILCFSLMKSEAVVFSFSAHHLCHPDDALNLLQFKKGILDINDSLASPLCDYHGQHSYPKMMTWNNTSPDCCTWDGVTCHQTTDRVIGLDLSCSKLNGVIHQNSTLFRLFHLINLNIAFNFFAESEISPNIRALSRLTHLNFSYSFFGGTIPPELSYLSKLVLLDLSDNFGLSFYPGDIQMLLKNLTHIRVLSLYAVKIPTSSLANWSSSLTYLDLGYTGVDGKLSNSIFYLPLLQTLILRANENLSFGLPKSNCLFDGIPDFICSFSSLKHLDLSYCGLSGYFTNSIGNLSQIVRLYLFENNFTGDISMIILSLPKLRELHLGNNSFSGQFPSYIGNLTELTMLGLQHNLLRGPLPSNMSGFRKLRVLYISHNQFDGTVPSWVFFVPSLVTLSLGHNYFTGEIKELESKSLEYVDFGGNQLDGPIPNSISQLINLKFVDFRDNQLDGPIPDSIFQLRNLSSLYLQSNNLSGSIVFTMFSHLKKLENLDLSNNKLSLKIENKINVIFPNFSTLGLSSCGITKFPNFLKNSNNLGELDLSNNKLHGQIPNWIPKDSLRFLNLSHNSLSSLGSLNTLTLMKNLYLLDLRSNQFQELLPFSICSLVQLSILDLSHNNFSGSIPECFGNFSTSLQVMNLAKNDLKGAISMSFPKDRCQLLNLNLNGNSLEGPLPRSLANCQSMEILDLGNNKINDTFPSLLETLEELQVLIFKSNRFFGSISNFKNKIFLPKLLVFDLSCNVFSGALPPELFKSFKAMATLGKTEPRASYMQTSDPRGSLYHFSMSFVMKGNDVDLVKIFTTFVVLDLSSNNFTGDIPEIIGNLSLLIALNLSHNNFSGHMPSTLGKLYFLESLDLSWNQIEGVIPRKLADITNLEFLNVSINHLRGRIPQGKQFNTFLNDSYYGNFGLCGFPVTKNCREIDIPPSGGSYPDDEDSNFWSVFTWKSVLIGYGFGFAIGCLVLSADKPKWLARDIKEVCRYALLLLGEKEMCKWFME